MNLRPTGDGVLVRMDPIPEKQGLVFLPAGGRVRTGEVLAVGPGRRTKQGTVIPMDLEKGERIAFYRENFEHLQGKMIVRKLAELGDDLGLLSARDILFAIPPGWNGTVS